MFTRTLNTFNLANASDDAHNYVRDGNGYSIANINYNAATGIEETRLTTGIDVNYSTPTDGMAAIPITLAKRFESLGGRYGSTHF